jgi:hypothetical protein
MNAISDWNDFPKYVSLSQESFVALIDICIVMSFRLRISSTTLFHDLLRRASLALAHAMLGVSLQIMFMHNEQ